MTGVDGEDEFCIVTFFNEEVGVPFDFPKGILGTILVVFVLYLYLIKNGP